MKLSLSRFITIPRRPAPITINTADIPVNKLTAIVIANIIIQYASANDFLASFIVASRISAHTQICIPFMACCTASISAKFRINAAMIDIITNDGNMTPSVAKIPPNTPANLYPIKVAVLTAITPGVH